MIRLEEEGWAAIGGFQYPQIALSAGVPVIETPWISKAHCNCINHNCETLLQTKEKECIYVS